MKQVALGLFYPSPKEQRPKNRREKGSLPTSFTWNLCPLQQKSKRAAPIPSPLLPTDKNLRNTHLFFCACFPSRGRKISFFLRGKPKCNSAQKESTLLVKIPGSSTVCHWSKHHKDRWSFGVDLSMLLSCSYTPAVRLRFSFSVQQLLRKCWPKCSVDFWTELWLLRTSAPHLFFCKCTSLSLIIAAEEMLWAFLQKRGEEGTSWRALAPSTKRLFSNIFPLRRARSQQWLMLYLNSFFTALRFLVHQATLPTPSERLW